MKVTVEIDRTLNAPELTLRTPALTPEVERLVRRLEREGSHPVFTAFRGGEAVMLPLGDILRFYTDGKGVSCQAVSGVYAVRERLYELEEDLAQARFVRVSNGEIVNLDRVTALDLALSGTVKITLDGGAAVCYASRRYVKKIKQAVGL